MSKQTYTPTHCPQTGRKFTKAERKAANRAKYALERATSKPKAKRKPKAQSGVVFDAPMSGQSYTLPTRSKAQLLKLTKAQLVEIIVGSEAKASEPAPKKAKASKSAPSVRKPRRKSNEGIEQSQARNHTANKVGKAVKTKVVHAITEGDAQPLEPRKEVTVEERKAVKREQFRLTLLPGETPEEGIRRFKIQQALALEEKSRIEAEQLLSTENI